MMRSDKEKPYIMQNFIADSLVLKLKPDSNSTTAKFSNQEIVADLSKSTSITIKLETPNFPDHALLF